MIGNVHLFLIRKIVTPFYNTTNKYLLFIGSLLRNGLIFIFKCDLSPSAKIPASTKLPHYIGIVVAACEIGENCYIRQNTTIGGKYEITKEEAKKLTRSPMIERRKAHPIIGNNVNIGANTCILGAIKVGDNSIIGAGSVVVKDVEPYSVYVGIPAKKIRSLK